MQLTLPLMEAARLSSPPLFHLPLASAVFRARVPAFALMNLIWAYPFPLFRVSAVSQLSGEVVLLADYREAVSSLFDSLRRAEPHGMLEARRKGGDSVREREAGRGCHSALLVLTLSCAAEGASAAPAWCFPCGFCQPATRGLGCLWECAPRVPKAASLGTRTLTSHAHSPHAPTRTAPTRR